MKIPPAWRFVVLLPLCLMAGCADTSGVGQTWPVRGKITVDDEPFTAASTIVLFKPDASKGNTSPFEPTGSVDSDGVYTLTTKGKKGAPPGWYKVIVTAREEASTVHPNFVSLGGAYVAAFWNTSGSMGEPARAVVSIFYPDPHDVSSNVYRLIEDTNLKYTVKLNPMGLGFGKPFVQLIPLPNILILDPYYLYVPHNTIYWVWMRLGPIGYFALWYLLGAIIIRGCIIARQLQNRYLQLVAIYIVAITFMEIIVAFADYQLFFYRNVIYLGLLVGILVKLPSLDDKKEQNACESPHDHSTPAIANVGSSYTQLSPAKDTCAVS